MIAEWFKNGRDFYEGVDLLRRAGRAVQSFEPYLSENFVPPFFRELLQNEIETISEHELTEKRTIVVTTIVAQSESEIVAELRKEAKMLHKRHADRHAQLHILETDELRLPVIIEIMEDIIPALDDIYDAIRNGGVRKKGVKRADADAVVSVDYRQGIQEGFQKSQRMMYLKNRIFKLSSKNGLIKTEKDETNRLKFEKELTQKQNELDALEIELGITKNERAKRAKTSRKNCFNVRQVAN